MSGSGQPLGFTGCAQLPFAPSVDVTPEEHTASTPSGLTSMCECRRSRRCWNRMAWRRRTCAIRRSRLPPGVELSPSAANGLVGCSEAQVGFEGLDAGDADAAVQRGEAECPDASKVGMVHIKTPLLPNELEGALYLADPAPNGEAGRNPFGSLVALYIVAKDPVSGVLVKLAGEGVLDEHTLRVATTFRERAAGAVRRPESRLVRRSAGVGEHAGEVRRLSRRMACSRRGRGRVRSRCRARPKISRSARVSAGRRARVAASRFSPGFTAFETNPAAGAFTGFQLELTHRDGDQALSGLSMHLPPGVAAMLSSVELCAPRRRRRRARVRPVAKSGTRRRSRAWARNRSCRKAAGSSSPGLTAARRSGWRS